MRRTTLTLTVIALLAVASTFTFVVWADSPHYTRGPFVADNGLTASANGKIAGLGNGDVIITLAFPNAVGTTICTNPGNGNEVPGQNPATPAAVSGSALITRVKNGTVTFTVPTDPPANPTPAAAGCPNKNWVAAFDDISFGNGTLTVQQETFDGSGVFVTVLTTEVFLP